MNSEFSCQVPKLSHLSQQRTDFTRSFMKYSCVQTIFSLTLNSPLTPPPSQRSSAILAALPVFLLQTGMRSHQTSSCTEDLITGLAQGLSWTPHPSLATAAGGGFGTASYGPAISTLLLTSLHLGQEQGFSPPSLPLQAWKQKPPKHECRKRCHLHKENCHW